MNKRKNLNFFFEFFALFFFTSCTAIYFFNLDFNFIYENKYFPWDSFEYIKFISNLENKNELYKILSPFNERILFPLLIYKISNLFNVEYINAALFINLFSVFFSSIIYIILSIRFNISIISRWLILIFFLFSWEGPFRAALYYPGSSFGFDCLLISIIIYFGYLYLEKKNKFYLFILFLCFPIFTLQRGIVILLIPFVFLLIDLIKRKFETNMLVKLIYNNPFSYLFLISFITLISLKLYFDSTGSYSALRNIIKFTHFRLNPLEFLYTYYFSLGPIFLVVISFLFLNKKNNIKNYFKIFFKNNIFKFFFSIFVTSVIFTNVGGDDSNRFALWYFALYLLVAGYCLDYLIKIYKNFIIISFIILGLFWSRCIVPAQPPLAFAEKFIFNQFVNTNFDPKLYYGIGFLKDFRNPLYKDSIALGDPYNLQKNMKSQNIYVSHILVSEEFFFNYKFAYKYRMNNIPFPIGYLHNQRDALIDHPTFGKPWVRFIYMVQWILISFLFVLVLKKKIKNK
jgi:hypothetical protein